PKSSGGQGSVGFKAIGRLSVIGISTVFGFLGVWIISSFGKYPSFCALKIYCLSQSKSNVNTASSSTWTVAISLLSLSRSVTVAPGIGLPVVSSVTGPLIVISQRSQN